MLSGLDFLTVLQIPGCAGAFEVVVVADFGEVVADLTVRELNVAMCNCC